MEEQPPDSRTDAAVERLFVSPAPVAASDRRGEEEEEKEEGRGREERSPVSLAGAGGRRLGGGSCIYMVRARGGDGKPGRLSPSPFISEAV